MSLWKMNALGVEHNNNILSPPPPRNIDNSIYGRLLISQSSWCLVITIGWIAFEQKSQDFREREKRISVIEKVSWCHIRSFTNQLFFVSCWCREITISKEAKIVYCSLVKILLAKHNVAVAISPGYIEELVPPKFWSWCKTWTTFAVD